MLSFFFFVSSSGSSQIMQTFNSEVKKAERLPYAWKGSRSSSLTLEIGFAFMCCLQRFQSTLPGMFSPFLQTAQMLTLETLLFYSCYCNKFLHRLRWRWSHPLTAKDLKSEQKSSIGCRSKVLWYPDNGKTCFLGFVLSKQGQDFCPVIQEQGQETLNSGRDSEGRQELYHR